MNKMMTQETGPGGAGKRIESENATPGQWEVGSPGKSKRERSGHGGK
jgi:hypothetical protein